MAECKYSVWSPKHALHEWVYECEFFFPKFADCFLFYLICNVAATCTKKLSKCMYKYICIHVLYCVFHLLSEIIKKSDFYPVVQPYIEVKQFAKRLPIILTSAIWTVYGCPWKIGALSFTSPIWMFTVSFTTWGGKHLRKTLHKTSSAH